LIAVFTICIDSLTLGEALNYMREEKGGFQYLIQGTLSAGIGNTEILVGIFTFRGKGWAWKSNVVSQIAGIILDNISKIVSFDNRSILNQETIIAPPSLPLILVQIVIGVLVLRYLFTPKVRSYFGRVFFLLDT
jgi:hypothetical protein